MDKTEQLLHAILEIEARNAAEIRELQQAQAEADAKMRANQRAIYDELCALKAEVRADKNADKVKEEPPIYQLSM